MKIILVAVLFSQYEKRFQNISSKKCEILDTQIHFSRVLNDLAEKYFFLSKFQKKISESSFLKY